MMRKILPLSAKAVRSVFASASLFSAFFVAAACQSAPAGPVELVCTVEGAAIAGSTEALCGVFQKQIEKAVKKPTRLAQNYSSAGTADRINVQVRVLKRGSVIADVSERRAGKMRKYPEIAIDVMDRPLAFRDIETLAMEVAKLVQR